MSSAAFGYLRRYTWLQVGRWLRRKHHKSGWKDIRRRRSGSRPHVPAQYDWDSPLWRHWLDGLAEGRTLLRYDERGLGLSDREVSRFSVDAWLEDLAAVVDAAGLEWFSLVGLSNGGAVAIAYAVRHPERVSHLVLCGAFSQGRLRRDQSSRARAEAQALLSLIRVGWGEPGVPAGLHDIVRPRGDP